MRESRKEAEKEKMSKLPSPFKFERRRPLDEHKSKNILIEFDRFTHTLAYKRDMV